MTTYNAVGKTAANIVRQGGVGYSHSGIVPAVVSPFVGGYVAAKMPMKAINPRTDDETGAYGVDNVAAKHRWAYYDGVNDVRYEEVIKIQGGAAPFHYEIIAGPAGATIGSVLGDASSHGRLKWVPTEHIPTATPVLFIVRVTGRDNNYIDVQWTVATSQSTDQFVFVDPTGGSDANDGTINTPIKTWGRLMGSTRTTQTFPYATAYLRAGTHYMLPHTDCQLWTQETIPCRCHMSHGYHPHNLVAFPDELVTLDFSGSEIYFDTEYDMSDWTIRGSSTQQLVIRYSSDDALETHNIWVAAGDSNRFGFAFVDFDQFIPRVNNGFTNSAPIFLSGSSSENPREYAYAHGVRETNRTVHSDNDGLLWVMFGLRYWADEYCSVDTSIQSGAAFKDTCFYTSSRYMKLFTDAQSFAFSFMGQSSSQWQEICYSAIKGRVVFNLQVNPATNNLFEYRNSIYVTDTNYSYGVRAIGGEGPYYSDDSIIVTRGAPQVSSNVTDTGNIYAVYGDTDMPFDTDTLELQNVAGGTAWRDTYLYEKGHEVI